MAGRTRRGKGPGKGADRGASARDVTRIKKAEAAGGQSEALFRELFDFMSSGVAVYEAVDGGADFLFRDFNPAAEKIERVRREDVLGRRVTEIFPGVKTLGLFAVFQRVWRTGTMEHFPAHLYKDERDPGSWRENWIFKLPTGEVVAVYNDITDRVRAEERLRESEEQLRAFMDNAPDGVYLNDLAGTFLYGNLRTEEITGYPREELIGKSMMELDLLSPDGLSKAAGLLRENAKGRATGPDELTLTKKDGSRVVVEINTSVVLRHGRPVVIGFVRDISARTRAEAALRRAYDRLALAQRAAGAGFWDWDMKTEKLEWSPELFRLFGLEPDRDKATFETWRGVLYPEDREAAENLIRVAIRNHERLESEYRIVLPSGDVRWISALGDTKYDADGTPLRMSGICLDISERKRSEGALLASEERTRALVETLPEGVIVHSQGRVVFANPASARLIGAASPADLMGRSVIEFVHPDYRPLALDRIRRSLVEGIPAEFVEEKFVRLDGTPIDVQVSACPLYFSGEPAMLTVFSNIAERKRAEEELRESEKRYRELYDFLPIPVYEMDLEANVTAANRAIFKAFRATEEDFKEGFNAWKLLSPEDVQRSRGNVQKLLKGEAVEGTEYVFTRLDGSTFPAIVVSSIIFDHGRPVGLRGAVIDITERKQAEDTVQATLREKEILLREIHHRVKNNMQVISSLFNLQAGHVTAENARRVLKEGQLRIRSMALVHEKLYQSRDLSKIDFADYLRSLSAHLFHFYRTEADRIRLETDLEPIPLSVNAAVPCGLLVNELVSNSLKHAFPENRKGTVEIGLHRKEDGSVELRVADDGVGFPEAMDFRRAESLGLQIVALLVEQIDGAIELERGQGTAFTISFREPDYKPRT